MIIISSKIRKNNVNLPLITLAETYKDKIAIATNQGTYTYQDLLHISGQIATKLLQQALNAPQTLFNENYPQIPLKREDFADLQEQRVAFLVTPGFEYVATQWGIWRAGGIAVPLCVSHPRPELEYVITNAQVSIIVTDSHFESILRPIAEEYNITLIIHPPQPPLKSEEWVSYGQIKPLPDVDITRRALILYTSGTTGKPKGVVTTHANIQAQVTSLVEAWQWTERDRILHFLPLHHIHGIVNVLTCALWVGAECRMLEKFDAEIVFNEIIKGNLTLLMAVPTIYAKLITAWEQTTRDRKQQITAGCAKMRLMVSGSAALPVSVLEKWQQISGHFLLERYGMTEIGMALSNPLHGQRTAGAVGQPLPQVEVRLVDDNGNLVPPETPGEIQVKGAGVFLEYWQNPEATAKSFDNGWFRTGDLAVVENGNYRILGRISVDIIKTGGYKVSALEIEETLRTHPDIQECAVVGIKDIEWGERVCAALVLRPESSLTLESLRIWAKERLAVYKVPTRIITLTELPRNAMGKVTKPTVAQLFDY